MLEEGDETVDSAVQGADNLVDVELYTEQCWGSGYFLLLYYLLVDGDE